MFASPKISLLYQALQVMSLPSITNLTATNPGRYHLALGIIPLYHFYAGFNIYPSCYCHLEACHFIASLKFVT
ncbi:hypothetical protein EDB87DRAFT_1643435 [Lactarius vividus]|nr:hypothetical protein EDB87DRAFT_1643435 [Lactarius vividus]